MGRVKELSTVVDELRQCGERLISIADEITAMFDAGAPESDSTVAADETAAGQAMAVQVQVAEAAQNAETQESSEVPWDETADPIKALQETPLEVPLEKPTEKSLTLEEVRAVLAEKSRAGHTAEVRDLLHRHGADRLSAVDPFEYRALLAEAEVIGHAG